MPRSKSQKINIISTFRSVPMGKLVNKKLFWTRDVVLTWKPVLDLSFD